MQEKLKSAKDDFLQLCQKYEDANKRRSQNSIISAFAWLFSSWDKGKETSEALKNNCENGGHPSPDFKVPGLDLNEENRMEAILNLAEEIKPELKGKNNLNISIEALDSNSMSSIRQTLFNAIDIVFDFSRALFFNAKKIFYVLSMILMVHDAYR